MTQLKPMLKRHRELRRQLDAGSADVQEGLRHTAAVCRMLGDVSRIAEGRPRRAGNRVLPAPVAEGTTVAVAAVERAQRPGDGVTADPRWRTMKSRRSLLSRAAAALMSCARPGARAARYECE